MRRPSEESLVVFGEGRRARLRQHGLEFFALAGSTAAFQASRLLIGVIAARWLGPDEYAVWGVMLAVLSYTNFASLGVLNGANREIPLRLGRREWHAASSADSVAFVAALAAAGACVSAGLLVALFLPATPAWAVFALVLGSQQLYLHAQVSLRSRLEFNRASAQQLSSAIVFALIGGLLLPQLGITALPVAQLAAFATAIGLTLLLWRRHLRPKWDVLELRALAHAGFPIMLAGLLFAVVVTADRWLVAGLLGPVALGHYTLAALISSACLLVSTVIAQQFYPRIAIAIGRQLDPARLWKMALRQSGVAVAAVAPLVLALLFAAPAVIPAWLPDYAPTVPTLQILALGMLVLVAGGGFSNLLVAAGRSSRYLAAQITAVVIQIALALMLVRLGFGIAGIALAASIGFLALTAGVTLAAARTVGVRRFAP